MRTAILLLACVVGGRGAAAGTQALDSVVASIGNVAITATDVRKEYDFERFLADQWPPAPPDADALNAARQRLTYQMLLTAEENPGPAEKSASEAAAGEIMKTLRKKFAHPEDFSRVLKDLGMTEADVLARIAQQELMLRLVDQRLRPAASPSDDEVAAYYRSNFVPEFQKKNGGAAAPPLSAVESQIREILVQQRINQLLEQWIDELKSTASLRFHSF